MPHPVLLKGVRVMRRWRRASSHRQKLVFRIIDTPIVDGRITLGTVIVFKRISRYRSYPWYPEVAGFKLSPHFFNKWKDSTITTPRRGSLIFPVNLNHFPIIILKKNLSLLLYLA